MPRKQRDYRRTCEPDSLYKSEVLTRFINKVMIQGKKSKAESIVYGALKLLSEKVNKEPLEAFESAMRQVIPVMEVKSRRVGGSTYQVPIEVKRDRGASLAMRWIVKNARSRKGGMTNSLAQELIDAFNGSGTSVKKREDTHKMAESNKAFAHFRW